MRRARSLVWSAVASGLLSLNCLGCADPPGLDVDVDVSSFEAAQTLRLVFTATPGGFAHQDPSSPENKARVTTEDTNGDGELELVTQFNVSAKDPKVHFRVATGNHAALSIHGRALAFDQSSLVAKDEQDAPITAGGRAKLTFTLAANNGEVLSPNTRTTDLGTASADVVVQGAQQNAPLTSMAACDLDGDGHTDVVLGAPAAQPNTALGSTGAVYVVFGDGSERATIELGNVATKEFHFFGKDSADKLGTAVACADLNKDSIADLIVGAPGAAGDKGKVYVVFGRTGLRQTTINLSKVDQQPDVQWTTAVDMPKAAAFGSALYAADMDGDGRAEILASAPGASLVHLFTNVTASATPLDADKPDHPTFTGVSGKALGAGNFSLPVGSKALMTDVVIGDPEFKSPNQTFKTGVVYVYRAVPLATPTVYTAAVADAHGPTTMIVGAKEMQFGAAVLALDTTGRGQDLFVGAANAGMNGEGTVLLYEHNDSFFDAPMRDYTENKVVANGQVKNGHFGSALAGSPTGMGAATSWRLLVGAPDAIRGSARTLAGAAYMFGGADLKFPLLEEVFGANQGDRLGAVVAGAQVDADGKGDLLALAPNATGVSAGTGVVYVKLGQ